MKRISGILIFVVVCVMQMDAQNPGDGLLFSQFQRGTIKYRNNTQQEAILNYNTIEQEFLFLSNDNTIMAIGEPQNVDMIIIGHRSFVPAQKDMFYEMLKAGDTNFLFNGNLSLFLKVNAVLMVGIRGLLLSPMSLYHKGEA